MADDTSEQNPRLYVIGDIHGCLDLLERVIAAMTWYERGLRVAARSHGTDVVFSVTNYLPLSPLPVPALLLVQHAGHFSPVFDRLMHAPGVLWRERVAWRAKRSWVRRSVSRAQAVTVQTRTLAEAIASQSAISRERLHVVPHGPGWIDCRAEPAMRAAAGGGPLRIGYVSKFGVQKNFRVLFRAVKSLADEGRDVRLVLTLDPAEAGSAPVLADLRAVGLWELTENHGEVSPEKLTQLYDGLDIFVFPSLCESFGMPMLEAMARGLPILVADTSENREMVGPAGLTFPAHDADALASLLRRLHGTRRSAPRVRVSR